MKTLDNTLVEESRDERGRAAVATTSFGSGGLHLISSHEMQSLRNALIKGALPQDFEAKLRKLANQTLLHRFVEQSCRLFVALLQASYEGSFCEASPTECERLLRVLAYVRRDDDVMPDYKPGGFLDDQQEVRMATAELGPLLQTFKAWRLRHQVPAMWESFCQ